MPKTSMFATRTPGALNRALATPREEHGGAPAVRDFEEGLGHWVLGLSGFVLRLKDFRF